MTLPLATANSKLPEHGAASRWALAIALSNTFAVSALVGIETLFMALSLDWSLAGIFNLGPAIYLPLGALMVGGAAWLTVWVSRKAWAVERQLMRGAEPE